MADINIKAGISLDTGDATQGLATVQSQLEKTGKSVKAIDNDTKGATGTFGKLKSGLTDMSPALGGVEGGLSKVTSAMKVLAVTPLLLVITLIVGALSLLYKAFTSTADGADKVSFVFTALKSVITTVLNTVLEVGGAIVKFFSGDFKGAMAQGSAAVLGFGKNAVDGFNRAYQAASQLDDIEDKMKSLNVERAKQNAQLRASKEALNDENVSISQKKKLLKEVGDAETALGETEKTLAKQKVQAIKDRDAVQIKSGRQSQEQIDDLQNAETALYNKEEELTGKKIGLQRQASSLLKQQNAEAKTASEAALAAQIERDTRELDILKEKYNKEYEVELAHKLKRKNLQLMTSSQMLEEQKLADEEDNKRRDAHLQKFIETHNINALMIRTITAGDIAADLIAKQDAAAAEIKLEAEKANARVTAAQATGEALGALSVLIGQQTLVGKGLAIAQATINTFTGATEVLRAKTVLPEPFGTIAKIANVTAIIATGIASVKRIASVQVQGATGGGGGGAIPSVPSPVLPQQTNTNLNAASIQAVGNAAAGGVNRNFVLDADISNSADRAARLNRAARLG